MKKKILHSMLFLFAVLLGTILPASLPRINIEVAIKSDNHSIVQAQGSDNSGEGQPGCYVWSNYDLDKIAQGINDSYSNGYRLKQFFVVNANDGLQLHYAATCRN